MNLLEMRIKGFKSFAKNTTLNLNANIVSIVGPNGSGKSNIVDALRWLLGEQSSKQIRISEKYDVIFGGSEKFPPAKKAEVYIKIKDDNGKIRTIGKTLSADGKIQYKIDNKNARLKDIYDVIGGAGVGKSFYSIISQDQVRELVSASSDQLRIIIEDAAGIKTYLEKKEIALKMLNQTKENLDRLNDVLYEVEKRVRSLSNRASRARKYMEYNNELKTIGIKYFGAKSLDIDKKIKNIETAIQENKDKIKSYLSKSFEVERLYKELKKEIEEKEEQLSIYGEKIENFRQRLKSYEEMKIILEKEINDLNSKIVEKDWERKKFEEDLQKNTKRHEEVKDLLNKYESENEKYIEEIKIVENEKRKIESSISEEINKLTELKEDIKKTNNLLKELENSKNKLINELADKEERLKFLTTEKETLEKTIDRLENELIKLESELNSINKKEEKLNNEIFDKKKIVDEQHTQLANAYNYLQKLKHDKDLTERKIQNLSLQITEYEGFSFAIKKLFEAFHKDENLIDVVLNLIEVPEELETAITMVAGYRLQNIVVKDSKHISSYINYLKAEKAGRVTFLPLDLINPKIRKFKELETEPGFYGYIIDLINYKNEFKNAIQYVFGNAIVVDSLNTALTIKNRYKNISLTISTTDGEIINTSGAITGGFSKGNNSTLLLTRKRELQTLKYSLDELNNEIKIQEELLKKLEYEYKKNSLELRKLEDKLNEIKYNRLNGSNSYKDFKNNYDSAKKRYNEIIKRIDSYKIREEEIHFELKNINNEIEENKEKIILLEKNVSEIEKINKSTHNELRLKIAKLDELNLYKNSITEKINNYKTEYSKIKNDIKTIENTIESINTLLKELKSSINRKKDDLIEYEKEIKNMNTEIEDAFKMMRMSREGKSEKFDELERLEMKKNELKDKIDELKNLSHELDLEIQNLNHEKVFLIEKAKNIGIDKENFLYEELNEQEILALERRIEDIKRTLKHIGSVDLAVLDEYEMVKKELDDRKKQKEDILQSIKTLQEGIEKIDNEAEEKYLNTFKLVNEKFGFYIKELFVGGDGILKMIGDGKAFEKGVEISVKKPGRNFQKLQLFSGGEKALITSAFLFALMNVNPSPFYLLDEIDAPLDDINAGKLAKLIKNNIEKTQFIIITHNKLMMEIGEIFHGITMRYGVSQVVPVDFKFLEELDKSPL
ncbi:condensin subunit Smc [Marinitoga hydrogenitolerans DSM 16785]|uniref:Chromosome partition protein Smc n=1 Tax=Marinitoga hydrogenitolerans (strain DSM 16785 / JCM 12826 / AT1271) TaxID=1122195 RepID=A0A1M4S9M5_MARH1|nr:chromosome segregation protein SMC [Marinitoga hydrogenitolerans]SHE28923.1 condensin subunit Smc [Marinitoga hydrogenitolerans DSM 16785]